MLKDWSAKRVLITYGRLSDAEQVEIAEIIVQFWKYCEDHVADRRAQRADDITSDLVDLADAKPDQLNDFDIVNMVYSMALAGHETTCNTIGSCMRALLTDRTQWQRADRRPVADPERRRGDPALRRPGAQPPAHREGRHRGRRRRRSRPAPR